MAKGAGFRVGHLGSLFNGGRDGFVIISCRVAKLGISDEALQAWHLERSQYFMVLVRYTDGYKSLDSLLASGTSKESGVQLRVGLSDRYKVALDQAIAAFVQLEDKSKSRKLVISDATADPKTDGLGRVFIGRPLDELMNERLVPLLKYRSAMDFPWRGAEDFFNDHQGRNLTQEDAFEDKYWAPDESHRIDSLPKLVTQDHLVDQRKEKSFPLLAMQFALRHLVRCTEFCLVCHCKVEADFEALKPYVCSKPLCLYQYMSLGFGPSIEHEIITQPHVVDLLISFCYTSASHRKLAHLPTGMALMVPSPQGAYEASPFPSTTGQYHGMTDGFDPDSQSKKSRKKALNVQTYKARFDQPKMELVFPPGSDKMLHPGYWITFSLLEQRYHCRVTDVMFPTVKLGPPIVQNSGKGGKPPQQPTTVSISQRHLSGTNSANIPPTITPAATPPPVIDLLPSQLPEISFAVYDQNFDDLNDEEKAGSICTMLNNLPSVQQMGDFLRSKGAQDVSLRSWADRISPAALGILRWIIASNRSCIIQVDSVDGTSRKSEERVSGMSGWMQFRFAQGAPDKEQRFVTSIRNTTEQQKHPTMFAWHGSPLQNWHGIVREGLHFQKADHGRAFGDGCYHSLDAMTSLGYSGGFYGGRGHTGFDDGLAVGQWPHSQLRISQAIALNEIVNAPAQFQSKSPHLVVAQLDWIQSRYLFVKCSIQGVQINDSEPSQVYEQDPTYSPKGDQGKKIVIPITAVSKSRRPVSKEIKNGNKKVKVDNVQDAEEVALLSDETDIEDVTIFFSDTEEPQVISSNTIKGKEKVLPKLPTQHDTSKTDFQPGTLDHKHLPLLEPPSFATSMATKALQKELTATLKVQDTHPIHELGWYIDRELINNVYQWIVELHTFEPHLPLAKDMKSKNLKSVVMEVRFGKNYPMSPPFVRVIRPRFLSFMQGGGGHVTAGGALCMELLTNSGWSAVSNIESVLLQVRLAMSSTDPKPARLEPGPVRDYQQGEAVEAFIRACNAHGVSTWFSISMIAYANTSTVGGTARLPLNVFWAFSIIRWLLTTVNSRTDH
jgi:ubiquitin-conjugating enzyme E2 Q